MKPTEKICIIIPAYNEDEVISGVLDSLPRSVEVNKNILPITTVVVNDGSSDNTCAEVSKRDWVVLINHIMNSGAGAATRTGLSYARQHGFTTAVTMDADGQHHPMDALRLIKESLKGEADLIIGTRFKDTAGMPTRRIIGTRGLNFITFMLFGVLVSDVQSGMKAFNRRAIEKIRIRSNNFAFCSEIIWMAHVQKLRIAEIPIKVIYTKYSLSKGQLGQTDVVAGIRFLRQLLKQRIMRSIDG